MTVITQLPDPPSRTTPSQFSTRTDAFLGALPGFVTETNAVASEVNADKTTAVNSAAIAVTKAAEASSSAAMAISVAGLTRWTSGQTYTEGASVYSPINSQAYRRVSTGAGTVDPSLDRVNWRLAIDDGVSTHILTKDETVQIYSSAVEKEFTILSPARVPFMYSEDGTSWEVSDGMAKTITGNAYVSGMKNTGVLSVQIPNDTAINWGAKTAGGAFLNGYLYVFLETTLYQFSYPAGVLTNSTTAPFTIGGVMSDGINIIAFASTNIANNKSVWAGGNLSFAPTTTTFAYPLTYPGKIFAHDGTNSYIHYYDLTFGGGATPAFNNDGSIGYLFSTTRVLKLHLSTAYDLTTATFTYTDIINLPITLLYTESPRLAAGGTRFYVSNSWRIYQYDLSTAYDFSTISYSGKSLEVYDPTFSNFYIKPDGTKIFTVGNITDSIIQYTLSTPYDLNTASAPVECTRVYQNPTSIVFTPTGLVSYVYVAATNVGWHKITYSTAWLGTTGVDTGIATTLIGNVDLQFTPDGRWAYFPTGTGYSGYYLSTAWELSTATGVATNLYSLPTYVDALVKYSGTTDTVLGSLALQGYTGSQSLVGTVNGDGKVFLCDPRAGNYELKTVDFTSGVTLSSYPFKYMGGIGGAGLTFKCLAWDSNTDNIYAPINNIYATGVYSVCKFGGNSSTLVYEEIL